MSAPSSAQPSSAQPKVSGAATILNAEQGLVQYELAEGDTDTVGTYKGEFKVTFPSGKTRTFPGADYLAVRIVADLG